MKLLTNMAKLFENKVDHATYFGANLEYIEGQARYLDSK